MRTCWPRSSGWIGPITARSPATPQTGEAIKLVARSHQTMIWERTRHVLRLRSTLREYFPAALATFVDLDEPEALELLAAAPDPDRAARLSKAKIAGALQAARRRNVDRPGGARSSSHCGLTRCGNQPRCRPRSPRSRSVRCG